MVVAVAMQEYSRAFEKKTILFTPLQIKGRPWQFSSLADSQSRLIDLPNLA